MCSPVTILLFFIISAANSFIIYHTAYIVYRLYVWWFQSLFSTCLLILSTVLEYSIHLFKGFFFMGECMLMQVLEGVFSYISYSYHHHGNGTVTQLRLSGSHA